MRFVVLALGAIGLLGCGAGPSVTSGSPGRASSPQHEAASSEHAPAGDQPVLDLGLLTPVSKGLLDQLLPTPGQTPRPSTDAADDDSTGRTGKPGKGEHGERKPPRPGAAETSSDSGRLTAEQVDEVISERLDLFSRCTTAESVISVRATVAAEGRVLDVSAGRSSPDDARLRDCVIGAFRSLVFPRTQANWPTRVAFDLRLTPQ